MKKIKEKCHSAIEKIKGLTDEELCEIYHVINKFEWDKRLGDIPEGFERLEDCKKTILKRRTRSDYLMPICAYIESVVTRKELLKYHHIHNLHKTNEEFEDWWRGYCQLMNFNNQL